jgi:(1->4)-alpha-D-glucan 1-alpha-D-glucosylmutase
VDYRHRQQLLQDLIETARDEALRRTLLDRIEDGRAKFYTTWRTLTFRQQNPQLFREGRYLALRTEGHRAEHLCAFARHWEQQQILVVAGRWFARLNSDEEPVKGVDRTWEGTWIEAPIGEGPVAYENVLTGEKVQARARADKHWLAAREVLRSWPVALLSAHDD